MRQSKFIAGIAVTLLTAQFTYAAASGWEGGSGGGFAPKQRASEEELKIQKDTASVPSHFPKARVLAAGNDTVHDGGATKFSLPAAWVAIANTSPAKGNSPTAGLEPKVLFTFGSNGWQSQEASFQATGAALGAGLDVVISGAPSFSLGTDVVRYVGSPTAGSLLAEYGRVSTEGVQSFGTYELKLEEPLGSNNSALEAVSFSAQLPRGKMNF